MKRTATWSIRVMAILIITISLAGCQQGTNSPPSPEPSSPITTQGNTKVYSNSTYGFSFTICNNPDFELIEKGSTVALLGPYLADMKYRIGIFVIADKVPKNTKLDDYLKAGRKEAESTVANFAITSESTRTVAGIQAKSSQYTYTLPLGEEDFTFKNTLVAFIKNDTVYALKYDTPEEFYDQYVECFNLLLSTFKFK